MYAMILAKAKRRYGAMRCCCNGSGMCFKIDILNMIATFLINIFSKCMIALFLLSQYARGGWGTCRVYEYQYCLTNGNCISNVRK